MKQTATANYLASALRRSGHALLVVSDVAAPGVDCVTGGAPDVALLADTRGFAPDLVLFVEGGTMRLLPVGLEAVRCPSAWYAIDTHMDYGRHLRLSRLFDVTFVAQKEFVRRLLAQGIDAEWLPLAFPSEMCATPSPTRDLDLAFVGSMEPAAHPERVQLLQRLRETAKVAAIGPATPAEMFRRYARAKIVFNKSIKNDVNMRYFEAMGAGAVLLTDALVDNGVSDLWEPGRHFVQYRSEDDLLASFKALLADPDRLREIAEAGQKSVLEHHTYDHRARQIVARMASRGKARHPDPADYFAAFASLNMLPQTLAAGGSALQRMGKGTRLGWLNRFAGRLLRAMALILNLLLSLAARLRRS